MNIKGYTTAVFAVAALSMGVAGSASAIGLTFDQFDGSDPSGTLKYDGNGGPLNGDGIKFDYFYNTNDRTDQNSRFVCKGGCTLKFTTGANTSESDNVYNFSSGGTYVLTGDVYRRAASGNDAVGDMIASGKIFSGSFTPSYGTKNTTRTGTNQFTFNGYGEGDLNQSLLDALGASDANPFTYLNTTYVMDNPDFGDNGSVNGKVTNTDFSISSESAAVPEPADMAMFAFGLMLLGGGLIARRRV